jgi:heme-degrading monooxygenase HmoA
MRMTVGEYAKFRQVFDENESWRQAAGATGNNQVYQDLADPNTVTLVLEWDNAEHARAFLDNPELRERQRNAGVVGAPAVRTVMSRT